MDAFLKYKQIVRFYDKILNFPTNQFWANRIRHQNWDRGKSIANGRQIKSCIFSYDYGKIKSTGNWKKRNLWSSPDQLMMFLIFHFFPNENRLFRDCFWNSWKKNDSISFDFFRFPSISFPFPVSIFLYFVRKDFHSTYPRLVLDRFAQIGGWHAQFFSFSFFFFGFCSQ